MKTKYVIRSQTDFDKWCNASNLLTKSLCPRSKVLKEYNNLSPTQRIEIKELFKMYDQLRMKKIPSGESSAWVTGIMVDANIIACEYNIDPLTAILCTNPICRPSERIIIK